MGVEEDQGGFIDSVEYGEDMELLDTLVNKYGRENLIQMISSSEGEEGEGQDNRGDVPWQYGDTPPTPDVEGEDIPGEQFDRKSVV